MSSSSLLSSIQNIDVNQDTNETTLVLKKGSESIPLKFSNSVGPKGADGADGPPGPKGADGKSTDSLAYIEFDKNGMQGALFLDDTDSYKFPKSGEIFLFVMGGGATGASSSHKGGGAGYINSEKITVSAGQEMKVTVGKGGLHPNPVSTSNNGGHYAGGSTLVIMIDGQNTHMLRGAGATNQNGSSGGGHEGTNSNHGSAGNGGYGGRDGAKGGGAGISTTTFNARLGDLANSATNPLNITIGLGGARSGGWYPSAGAGGGLVIGDSEILGQMAYQLALRNPNRNGSQGPGFGFGAGGGQGMFASFRNGPGLGGQGFCYYHYT